MAADQTIEIRLVLRDELSRQLQPIVAQVNQLNTIMLGKPQQEMWAFARTAQGARAGKRE